MEFLDGWHAAHHVLESGLVGLIVRNVFDGRRAGGALLDALGESFDGDFLGVADIHDFTDGWWRVHQADKTFDSIADVAEATGLLPIAVDLDRLIVERLLDEI